MQYEVAPNVLPRGLDTLRSKRTEDSRVKGCPAWSCHVSLSPVLSHHVLLMPQQSVPNIQSAVLKLSVNFRCPVPQIICHGLPPTTFELEREVECVLGHARQIWKRPIVMQR